VFFLSRITFSYSPRQRRARIRKAAIPVIEEKNHIARLKIANTHPLHRLKPPADTACQNTP